MFYRILVALDKSPISQYIFDEAVYLASSTGAKILLLNVLSPFDEPYGLALDLQTDRIYQIFNKEAVDYHMEEWELLKAQGIEYLTMLKNQAIAKGINTDFSQEMGNPSRMICNVARTWEADLIVMGRHGLSRLSEFFLGSVSSYVLHHAPCAVLTLQHKIPKNTEVVEEKPAKTGVEEL